MVVNIYGLEATESEGSAVHAPKRTCTLCKIVCDVETLRTGMQLRYREPELIQDGVAVQCPSHTDILQ